MGVTPSSPHDEGGTSQWKEKHNPLNIGPMPSSIWVIILSTFEVKTVAKYVGKWDFHSKMLSNGEGAVWRCSYFVVFLAEPKPTNRPVHIVVTFSNIFFVNSS